MTEQQRKLTDCLEAAIQRFNLQEQDLISRDLSERCICAKFASYLEKAIAETEFRDYAVDVEYNRGMKGNELAVKRLGGRNIVVDLVVHKRGFNEPNGFDNLICIEMKKSSRRSNLLPDMERLRMMTDGSYGFGYQIGFMIVAHANRQTREYQLMVNSTYYLH